MTDGGLSPPPCLVAVRSSCIAKGAVDGRRTGRASRHLVAEEVDQALDAIAAADAACFVARDQVHTSSIGEIFGKSHAREQLGNTACQRSYSLPDDCAVSRDPACFEPVGETPWLRVRSGSPVLRRRSGERRCRRSRHRAMLTKWDTQSRGGTQRPATGHTVPRRDWGPTTCGEPLTIRPYLVAIQLQAALHLSGTWNGVGRMLRGFLLSTMIVASMSPAQARRVELMSFAGVEPAAVIEDTSVTQDAAFPHVPMEAALSSNFAAIGAAVPVDAPAPLPTDGLSIPLWLQTGVSAFPRASASARLRTPVLVPPLPSSHGCGDTTYRPRHDLPSSTQARRAKLLPLVAQVACEAGIPVGLFDALIVQESRYQMGALSPKGAAGLTQLMPGTARELGVRNSWNPLENLRGGALYLRRQLNEFGRVDLALAAYNAGPGRVRARRRVPAISETMNYVATITQAWSGASRVATTTPFGEARPVVTAGRKPVKGVELASFVSAAAARR